MDINVFNAETPSDFCKCVEDLLQTSNHTSFNFTGEFISKDGVEYDVTVSYIRRDTK